MKDIFVKMLVDFGSLGTIFCQLANLIHQQFCHLSIFNPKVSHRHCRVAVIVSADSQADVLTGHLGDVAIKIRYSYVVH